MCKTYKFTSIIIAATLLTILLGLVWLQPSYAGAPVCVSADNLAVTLGPIKCFLWTCRSTVTVVHGVTYYIALVSVPRNAIEGAIVTVTGTVCSDSIRRVRLVRD